jgi:hypothetical protein
VIGEAISRVSRVRLLFGEGTKPAEIAGELLTQLQMVVLPVKDGGAEAQAAVPAAWQELTKDLRYEIEGAPNQGEA